MLRSCVGGAPAALLAVAAVVAVGPSCRFDAEGLPGRDGGAGAGDAGADRAVAADAPVDRGGALDGSNPDGPTPDGGPAVDAGPDLGLPAESCVNGTDDNGDGLVDCLDPACQADYACVDAPPPGWGGFFYLRQSPFTDPAAPPDCADGTTPARLSEGPVDAPASCSACTCGAPQGAACAPPVLTCWAAKARCNGSGDYDATAELARPYCVPGSPTNSTTSCQVTAGTTVASAATCAPAPVTVTRPAPWLVRDDVCAVQTVGGGCGAQLCARRPAAAYAALCIRHPGDVVCPAAWPTRHLAFATTTDTRGCTACACTPGAVTCSGGAYQLYGCTTACNGACGGLANPAPFTDGSPCQDVSAQVEAATWSSRYTPPTAVAGACAAAGGRPVGGVERSGAATLCCRP